MGRLALILTLAAAASLSACASAPRHATGSGRSASIECAPYARQVSGIDLYGDAADWWDQAAGRYGRSAQPSPGAVLVFQRSNRLPHGHVSVVADIRSGREITVTQANWVHGRIAHSEPVLDVSPGNDWTAVRVWWEPSRQLGSSTYPAYGFIAPGSAAPGSATRLQMSDASLTPGAAGVLCPAYDKPEG